MLGTDMSEYSIKINRTDIPSDDCRNRLNRQKHINGSVTFTLPEETVRQFTLNSQNIDPEFVKIVNDNFWDLI